MNKEAQKLLDKCIKLKSYDKKPLFKGIYIIQQRKLHDSGYRLMYVIGHTDYDKEIEDYHYYLISVCSDVIDFQPIFNKYIKDDYDMCDLHLDIDKNCLIHIWTNSNKRLHTDYLNLSSCTMEVI